MSLDVVKYHPARERYVDRQYRDLLREIVSQGDRVPSRQGVDALTVIQQCMRFDLRNGFPMITDRDVSSFWRKPIAEICAFINGCTKVEDIEAFGCDWWRPWASEEKTSKRGLPAGDLGPGSYGGAFTNFPTGEVGDDPGFDQFTHIIEQIRELPNLRTHFVSPWIPQHQARGFGKTPGTTISPCHGWVHVRVLDETLHLHMIQRSGDVPVGVPSNMIQYGALTLMIAHLTGYRAGWYYHTLSDAHIYVDQLDVVRKIIRYAEPRRLPIVKLDHSVLTEVKGIKDFRPHHFILSEYMPNAAIWPPVVV